MPIKYSRRYPPNVGDHVGMCDDQKVVEAFIVRKVYNGLLEVEGLTVSTRLGRSYPTGVLRFVNTDDVKLIRRETL